MDARQETLGLLEKIWFKLKDLPNAHPLHLGAFFVILTFILLVLLAMVLSCVNCCCFCCCRRRAKPKAAAI